jgi:protein-S-isoprenylcysteine O-methyltransferase Ste14
MDSLDHKIPPPVVGAVIAAVMWGASALGPQLPIATGSRHVMVALLVVAGVAFDLLGIVAFLASHTTVNPLKPERASVLVTGGVYRITRNPMYVGMGLLLLAWSVHLSALLPFVGLLIFVLYISHFQIEPEERALKEIFGDQYVTYAERVRRWL